MEYRKFSADCHLDMPWMPPELFVSEAPNDMKDRMPFVEDGPDGPQWVTKKGANFGLLNGVGPGGAKLVPGQNKRVDIMATTGMFDDGKKGIQRPSDPHLRLKEMEMDGEDEGSTELTCLKRASWTSSSLLMLRQSWWIIRRVAFVSLR